jgi:hypothetical protein
MQITLLVSVNLVDQKVSPSSELALELPDVDTKISLAYLISSVVREEVAAYNQKQKSRRLYPVLSMEEIMGGEKAGKIHFGEGLFDTISEHTAINAALTAFCKRNYLVFVDGIQYESLEAEFVASQDSRVNFVRLTPLVGG